MSSIVDSLAVLPLEGANKVSCTDKMLCLCDTILSKTISIAQFLNSFDHTLLSLRDILKKEGTGMLPCI